jgi:hypothetical protein
MKIPAYCLLILLYAGCGNNKPWRHARLISFELKQGLNFDSLIATENGYATIASKNFHHTLDTISYLDGKIYISYLSIENDCAELDGSIIFKGDSIFLNTILIGDEVCTEETCHRLRFMIENRENRKYRIIKG